MTQSIGIFSFSNFAKDWALAYFHPRGRNKIGDIMKNNSSSLKILNVKDIASILKMKESWVRQRVHKDEIPYYKIGNLVRFNYEDILIWLENKRER